MARTQFDIDLIRRCINDPAYFALVFFRQPGFLETGTTKLPDFQKQGFHLIQQKHKLSAIVWPRDHCKSTLFSKIYPIFEALRRPTYIRIFSATDAQSQKLSSIHNRIFRTHEKIIHYFGSQVTSEETWSAHRRVLANGSIIEYSSVGAETRGATSDLGRPQIIILDDIETREQARSQYLTDNLDEWLFKDLIPSLASGTGRIILLGTVISGISLANRIATGKMPGWQYIKKAAVDFEAGTVLWREHPVYGNLQYWIDERVKLAAINKLSFFASEYMNEYIVDSGNPISPSQIQHYDTLPADATRYFCCIDLAYTKKKYSDKTAYIVFASDPNNNIYIIEAKKAKLDLTERVNLCFDLFKRYRDNGLYEISIEGYADFIDTVKEHQRQRNTFFSLKELKTGGVNKADRILTLQPSMHTIFFPDLNSNELIEELLAWSETSTVDDLSDCLAYARKHALPSDKLKQDDVRFVPEVTKRVLRQMYGTKQGPDFSINRPKRI